MMITCGSASLAAVTITWSARDSAGEGPVGSEKTVSSAIRARIVRLDQVNRRQHLAVLDSRGTPPSILEGGWGLRRGWRGALAERWAAER
jgi:hypothetical protein